MRGRTCFLRTGMGRPDPEVRAKPTKGSGMLLAAFSEQNPQTLRLQHFYLLLWYVWGFSRKTEGFLTALHLNDLKGPQRRDSPPRNLEGSIPKTNCSVHPEILKLPSTLHMAEFLASKISQTSCCIQRTLSMLSHRAPNTGVSRFFNPQEVAENSAMWREKSHNIEGLSRISY